MLAHRFHRQRAFLSLAFLNILTYLKPTSPSIVETAVMTRAKRDALAMMTPSPTVSSKRARIGAHASKKTLIWKPKEWILKVGICDNIEVLRHGDTSKLLIVKKVLKVEGDERKKHFEIRALETLPPCSRIVNMLAYEHMFPNPLSGSAFFDYYPLGDLHIWKHAHFTVKNFKPVPESYIWRLFVQIAQALAFIQNHIGPHQDQRQPILHRDIKPKNILVVDNGSTYPSFRLHDFGCGKFFKPHNVQNKTLCGTFEWQPPENPRINTFAADIWSLGAVVHYLAIGKAPLQNIQVWEQQVRGRNKGRDPAGATDYDPIGRYYAATVPREVTPINLTKAEQRARGIAPYRGTDRAQYNPTYSEELNYWMEQTLSHKAVDRPSALMLLRDMIPEAKDLLQRIGRKPALTDIEPEF